MLPNGAAFLCIQILLIFPSVPPAAIGHLAKGPDLVFSCMCTLWPANLCITTPCVMERIKLCWAGRQETRLLCVSTSTCGLGNRVTETAALSEQKGRLKSLLFCFFYLYIQKALNIYLISYKALGGQVVDFKGRSRPVAH